MDIHVQSYETDIHKESVINMGTELYNNMPHYIKGMDSYKAFKKELNPFLLYKAFYSVEELVCCNL